MASDAGYLPKVGAKLIDAGYRIVPIAPGTKQPIEPKWTSIYADKSLLARWLDPEYRHPTTDNLVHYARGGAGIITEQTPAVDIDVSDRGVSEALESWVNLNIGFAPTRVGREPKRLMVFRTEEPFPKITSTAYLDGQGTTQRVEILCAGQQFVAYAIHPDTEKPYRWLYGDSPLDTPVDQLCVLSHGQALEIVAEFDRLAQAAGWTLKTGRRDTGLTTQRIDRDNPFASDKRTAEIAESDLHRKLLLVPNAHDYETWVNVGMSLHHQYAGADRGLELWHEWSEQAVNYDREALDSKWPTFEIATKGREPLTARYIIKLAAEEAEKIKVETFAEVKLAMERAVTLEALKTVCVQIKNTEFDEFQRPQLVAMVQKQYRQITGSPLTIGSARAMTRFEAQQTRETPFWLKSFVYDSRAERFYNVETGAQHTVTGFNSVNSRHMLSKLDVLEGKSTSDNAPSDVALNLYQIPIVDGLMYLPGQDQFVEIDGLRYLNSYSDRGVPVEPDRYTNRDRYNVDLVMEHFAHLFDDPEDRRHLLDFIGHVTRGGERINYAPLIQGVEGDGKSFFYELMEAMLGRSNVSRPAAKLLGEDYTGWCEGSQLVFFEEVKLQGHNRYDILNAVKPMLTNSTVSVRKMRTDAYDTVNVTSYMFATNYRDALPLGESDSRYLVLFSKWQDRSALLEFEAEHPDYYVELYGALNESPGALRKHFRTMDLSPGFNPRTRAPRTKAKAEMVSLAKGDEQDALEDVLSSRSKPDLTPELMNSGRLSDALLDNGAVAPQGKAMNKLLSDRGFSLLGRMRFPGDKNKSRVWSVKPSLFRDKQGDFDPIKALQWCEDWL